MMSGIPFSVLDLAPVAQGSTPALALARSVELAQRAEAWGYRRFWLAEHHNMPGIASAATVVVMAHVAAHTRTIRIGSGGIMLPNHAPLIIAEQFGTLESLHPGRIDLGLGRAPGTDQVTMRALRRTLDSDPDAFPEDVLELIRYFRADRGDVVRAIPGAGLQIPIWILGSSLFGAEVAATLGLPYAFASHFAPAMMLAAIERYRARFRPSAQLAAPYVMLGANMFLADSDAEARLLFTSLEQAFVNLRSGRPGQLPPPSPGYGERLEPALRAMIDETLAVSFVGSPASVRGKLQGFLAATRPDELMITAMIHDHGARLRSFELAAGLLGEAPLATMETT